MSSNAARRSQDTAHGDGEPEAGVDAYIARNREALNTSIRRARQEAAEGIHDPRSIDEIIADGHSRCHGD